MSLVSALGYRSVAAVVGHDFGSPVAAHCSLIRPDVFRSAVLMSAPFAGPPSLPFNTAQANAAIDLPHPATVDIHGDLSALNPPRKHYQWYYSTREPNSIMLDCPRVFMSFSARTPITKAQIVNKTDPSRSSRGPTTSCQNCPPTT